MVAHVSSYQTFRSRAASGGGEPPPQPMRTWTTQFAVSITNGVSTGVLFEGLVPASAWYQQGVLVIPPLRHVFGQSVAVAGNKAIEAQGNGDDFWAVNGVLATNGGSDPFFAFNPVNNGRQNPGVGLTIAGDALTATGALTEARGVAHWAHYSGLSYQSVEMWCDLEEWPPGTANLGSTYAITLHERLENMGSTFSLGTKSNGEEVVLRDCGYAAFTPNGQLWLRPEDFGNQNEQIPISVGDNTPQHFRFFPGVFFRRGAYVHSVGRINPDPIAINLENQASQPFRLTVVGAAPTASDWLVSIDGAAQLVRIFHPAGSDLRRPDEIWQALWVPALQLGSNFPNYLVLSTSGLVANSFTATISRLRYAQYFRCTNIVSQSLTDTPQTDTGLL